MGQATTLSPQELDRLARIASLLAERNGTSPADVVERMEEALLKNGSNGRNHRSVFAFAADARALRVRRNDIMGVPIFRDPAWDMLLDMLVADHEGREVCVSSLCYGSGVPATTALRTLDRLEGYGLIHRTPDPKNGRRILVTAQPEALTRVADMLARIQESA